MIWRSQRLEAGYVLVILFLANCFNSMDRSIFTLLVEPIKHDLHLDDTEIGLIAGLGYAGIYTLASIVLARVVDRGNRKNLLAGGLAAWSVMTAITGFTTGFATMLGARFGIAAGEATCYPNALSLIGDYYERAKRPRAIAVFQLGTYGGIIVGVATAGVIAAHEGWRVAFRLIGLPGLVLSAIIALTVREPPRGMNDAAEEKAASGGLPPGGAAAMIRLLAANPGFRLMVFGAVLLAVGQIVMGSWVPAFLMRVHHVGQQQVGLLAGPIFGLSGIIGTLVGGFLGTRIAQKQPANPLAPLAVVFWSAPFAVPALLLFLFAPSLPIALAGAAVATCLISLHYGPLVAVTIGAAGIDQRGVASSLLVMGQFLVGFGLGPLIVGALSDWLQPSFGPLALRYAMLAAPLAVGLGWLIVVQGAGRLRRAG